MFEYIGKKIKTLAIAAFVFEAISAAGFGLYIMSTLSIILGIFLILIGIFISWISAFALYGYGEMIDATMDNRTLLRKISNRLKVLEGSSNTDNRKSKESDDNDSYDDF